MGAGLARGHLASIDYAGESVRDAELASRETDVFLALAAAIGHAGIPATVSFDLSQALHSGRPDQPQSSSL